LASAVAAGVPAARIGQTGGSTLRIAIAGEVVVEVPVTAAESPWSGSLKAWLEGRAA
jgi:hypothetical protein